MSLTFVIILFILGFIGSFLSGMLGVGGAIINYPLILFIPPMLGLSAFSAHEAAGVVAVQVFFATLSGVFSYKKSGCLDKSLIVTMGISVLTGSLIGGYGSQYLSGNQVNIIYGVLALLAVIMMLIPVRKKSAESTGGPDYSKPLAAGLAFLVGLAAGVVGAGGAFLLVPIMLTLLKIPVRITIATSLAVTFISSIGSVTGKLVSDQILFMPALVVVVASLLASPLGAKSGQKLNTKVLKGILMGLILLTAIKIWSGVLF